MIIDPSNLEVQEGYKLLIGSVVPRPIAWTFPFPLLLQRLLLINHNKRTGEA